MIHLDTSFLIAALTPGSNESRLVERWLTSGEQLGLSAVTWAEFLCGPVTEEQVGMARTVFSEPIALFADDAARAADLYNATGRRRGSLADCMIAAICLRLKAPIATFNAV